MKQRSTKNALLCSVLALAVCMTMLIGTTFAWFTDSVTSVGNVIRAGNLKVDIVDESGASLEGEKLSFRNKNGSTDILWEPGATFRTQAFHIKNAGNLALKYRLILNGIDGSAELLEVITFSIVKADGTAVELSTFEGTLTSADALSEVYYIQGAMSSAADNRYMKKTLEGIGVTVVASQAMQESDSFDDTYDADAKYPEPPANQPATPTFTVGTTSQLQAALQPDNSTGDLIVNLSASMELAAGETWTPLNLDSYSGVARVVINGNGHTIKGLNASLLDTAIFGNTKVEINDLTLEGSVVNSATNYAGAFLNYSDNAISVTLKNCHAKDAKVSSNNYAGALLGYVAGTVTIENCSVTGCTVTSAGSAGSLVGMISTAQGVETATISKISATGNNITSTKSGSYRVGELLGTANIKYVNLSDITVSGNTCTQAGATGGDTGMVNSAWIGRTSSTVTGDTSAVIKP